MIIVDSCMIWFHFDCIMQLKKSYHIATNVCSRKSATTFGDLPDWLMSLESNQISISGNGTPVCEIDAQPEKITELSPRENTSSTLESSQFIVRLFGNKVFRKVT